MRRQLVGIVVAGLATAAFVALPPAAAHADTACADVWVENANAAPTYVPGPGPGNCVPTPFTRAVHNAGGDKFDHFPDGTPCGFGYEVWLTSPV